MHILCVCKLQTSEYAYFLALGDEHAYTTTKEDIGQKVIVSAVWPLLQLKIFDKPIKFLLKHNYLLGLSVVNEIVYHLNPHRIPPTVFFFFFEYFLVFLYICLIPPSRCFCFLRNANT